MATFSKLPLSGSTNGKGINVSASVTAGTTIHTAVSGTEDFDEIWMYAVNTSASVTKLTVEYGGTTNADNIEITIPGEAGLVLVIPGLFLNNAQVVRAFASIPNILSIHGYVNRVT
jgi:hypothetical protein